MKFNVDFQNFNYSATVIANIILTKINPQRFDFCKEEFYSHLTEISLDEKNDVDQRVDSFFVEHFINPDDKILKYVAIVDTKIISIYLTPNEVVLFRNADEDWNLCWVGHNDKWLFTDLTDLIYLTSY